MPPAAAPQRSCPVSQQLCKALAHSLHGGAGFRARPRRACMVRHRGQRAAVKQPRVACVLAERSIARRMACSVCPGRARVFRTKGAAAPSPAPPSLTQCENRRGEQPLRCRLALLLGRLCRAASAAAVAQLPILLCLLICSCLRCRWCCCRRCRPAKACQPVQQQPAACLRHRQKGGLQGLHAGLQAQADRAATLQRSCQLLGACWRELQRLRTCAQGGAKDLTKEPGSTKILCRGMSCGCHPPGRTRHSRRRRRSHAPVPARCR